MSFTFISLDALALSISSKRISTFLTAASSSGIKTYSRAFTLLLVRSISSAKSCILRSISASFTSVGRIPWNSFMASSRSEEVEASPYGGIPLPES